MKKNLLYLAAFAGLFASCSSDDVLVDTNAREYEQPEISFDTYTVSQTRSENNNKTYAWNLEDHHTDFSVWSTKLVGESYIPVHGDGKATTAEVGKGVVVNWNATDEVWNPASKKYWDKAATSYRFFAAAPSSASWVINNSTTTNYQDAYFTLAGVTLKGTNLTESTGYTLIKDGDTDNGYKKSWKDAAGDVDLMIAAPCEISNISSITSSNQTVNLEFIHILSRLNVAFKKSSALENAVVKVTNFQVVNLVKGGDFNETKTEAANGSAKNCHWTPLANTSADNLMTLTGRAFDQALISTGAYYTIQSLVIPQDVSYEAFARNGSDKETTSLPYIYVKYTIDNEPYEAYINLADAFGKVKYTRKTIAAGTSVAGYYTENSGVYTPAAGTAVSGTKYYEKAADGVLSFNEGWQNNLTLTLDALEILFDATVSEWSDDQTASYTIQ